jgi:hypothetical protein
MCASSFLAVQPPASSSSSSSSSSTFILIFNKYYLPLIVHLIYFFETHSVCNEYYLTLFFLFLMFNKKIICIIGFYYTINLYNFILCIINNFLKTYLKIITEGFTDGIYPLAFDSSCHSHRWIYRRIYSVGISHSPTVFDSTCHNDRRMYRQISSVGISNTHR